MAKDNNSAYPVYCDAIEGLRLPLAFVDLDAFDAYIAYVAATQQKSGKTIRVASKSIRSIDLLQRIFELGWYLIVEQAGIAARLDSGGKMGELTVWVSDQQVVRKGFFKSPDREGVLAAVQQALGSENYPPV